jgi:hypothetical protein
MLTLEAVGIAKMMALFSSSLECVYVGRVIETAACQHGSKDGSE